jgi:hypothetical protein
MAGAKMLAAFTREILTAALESFRDDPTQDIDEFVGKFLALPAVPKVAASSANSVKKAAVAASSESCKCSAMTAKGTRCTKNVKEHGLCAIHIKQREGAGKEKVVKPKGPAKGTVTRIKKQVAKAKNEEQKAVDEGESSNRLPMRTVVPPLMEQEEEEEEKEGEVESVRVGVMTRSMRLLEEIAEDGSETAEEGTEEEDFDE